MPAAYRSHSTATSTSTSFSISRPTGTTDGDVLVLCQASNGGLLSAITTPSGWTQVAQLEGAGSSNLTAKAWVKLASSEGSSYGLAQQSGANSAAILICVESGELPAVTATSTSGSGTNVGTPGITPSMPTGLEIRFAAAGANGSSRTFSPPAGFTEPSGADVNSGGWAILAGAYRQLASSAATSAQNFTVSGTIAVRLGITVYIPSVLTPGRRTILVPSTAVHRASRW